MKVFETDAVIIGNTLAGQMAAYTLLRQKKCRVWMLGEVFPDISASFFDQIRFPQGTRCSAKRYYRFVQRTAAGQCDPALARILCEESAPVMAELAELGVTFFPIDGINARVQDEDITAALEKALPGERFPRLPKPAPVSANSWPPKQTGEPLDNPDGCLQYFRHWAAKRLVVKDGRVQGVLCADREQKELFLLSTGAVLLAGGIGPMTSSLAMGYYAGAALGDLEFIAWNEKICLPTGGLIITPDCRSTVPGLLAAGACACGIHGAGLKAGDIRTAQLVFGKRAGNTLAAADLPRGLDAAALNSWAEENHPVDASLSSSAWLKDAKSPYRALLSKASQITEKLKAPFCQETLEAALQVCSHMQHELNELPPASPRETISRLSLEDELIYYRLHIFSSLERRDSVGCFQRADYPNRAERPYRVRMGLTGMLLFPEKEYWQ